MTAATLTGDDGGHAGALPNTAKPSPTATPALVAVLVALTFITGVVDAISYLGLGRVFTANMTGNVVFLGFAVAGAGSTSVRVSATSLVAFLAGAAIGGELGRRMDAIRERWVTTALTLQAGMVFAAWLVAGFDFGDRGYVVVALLALAMGLQNATVRRLAIPDLTTTVLTLTLTGLAADGDPRRGRVTSTRRRIQSVAAMFGGAVMGAILLRRGLATSLLTVALTLSLIVISYWLSRQVRR